MPKIIECCESCDHWIRVNMPANVGLCLSDHAIRCGDHCCEGYENSLKPRKKARRKRGAQDGKTD